MNSYSTTSIPSISATIRAKAFAKALQIETCDSARNRTMWNILKSSVATATSSVATAPAH